jgi:hypothetical protein
MKTQSSLFFIFILSLFILSFSTRQAETPTIFQQISYQELVKAELETDLDSLLNTKKTEEEIPGTFSFEDANKQKQNWQVKIQVRGKFRRRICEFPPLRLTFSKKEMKEKGMPTHNNLKLVVHCVDNEAGDEYVLREYLAYKLYQILAPTESYRVQLLRVKYKDVKKKQTSTHYGILLEDEDELAERLNAKVCDDCYNTPKEKFVTDNLNTNDLFEYLIGNTDWSTMLSRNVKLLQRKEDGKFLVVPYDFDFSGFVSAGYASVDTAALKIKNVRQRVFLGYATESGELKKTVEAFQTKEKELKDLVRRFKYITPESRTYLLDYVDSFFQCVKMGLDIKTPGKC